MMGEKLTEPKLYYTFSLDAAVPQDHLLRRLSECVDFRFVRNLAKPYYSDIGQPSIDPVVIFKMSLLGYLYNVPGDRRLCSEASLHLAWRWFLGYELDESIPDHSTLSKARTRYGVTVFEQFFERIVQKCEAAGLIQGKTLLVDSTLVDADAAADSLRSRKLMEHRLPTPQEYLEQVRVINEGEVPLPSDNGEPPNPKGQSQGDVVKDEKVPASPHDDDEEPLQPKGPPQVRVVDREGEEAPPPSDDESPKSKGSSRTTINERVVSKTDPDARMVSRRRKPARLCHKVHFAVDDGKARVVTAVDAGPATEHDSQTLGRMIDKHHDLLQKMPGEVVADSGYGTVAAYEDCEQRGVPATLASKPTINRTGGFHRDEFEYVPERDVYICPTGKELPLRVKKKNKGVNLYRPDKGTCTGCLLRAKCFTGNGDRIVTRPWNIEVREAMTIKAASREGKRKMRRRMRIEPVIGDAKGNHGMGRARHRGRDKVYIQGLLTASVLNIKQLLKYAPKVQVGSAVGLVQGHQIHHQHPWRGLQLLPGSFQALVSDLALIGRPRPQFQRALATI